MRHVYVDAGAYTGDTVEEFLNWKNLAYEPGVHWDIYAFEPNPDFDYSRFAHHKNLKFIREAVWVKDGWAEFSVDPSPDSPMGSTLIPEKKGHWDIGKKIIVKTFDFSSWLEQFRGDHVIVKIDCEGAEFKVIEKMIQDKTIDIPYRLLVEFHQNKVTSYTTTDKDSLVSLAKQSGARIYEWH